jgi:tetratricopeptide (TPR) repeat protein
MSPRTVLQRLRPHAGALLLLFAATFALYAQALHHDFLINWDDQKYVTGNEAVRGFATEHLRTAITTFFVGNYAPLQILSYMLDYSLWGMRPAGFILTNILFHTANGLLLYLLVVRISGSRTTAGLAAAIFLLHPVQVETVAWVSQRKTLLALFFFLLSLHGYVSFRSREEERGRGSYLFSLATFMCALAAKVAAIHLPFLLVVYDRYCAPRERRRTLFLPVLPFFVLALVAAVVALVSQSSEFGGGRGGHPGGSALSTLYTMAPVFLDYGRLLVWPASLSAIYRPAVRTTADATVVVAFLALLLAVLLLVWLCRRHRNLFFWALLAVFGFVPVAQIVPLVTFMNDRYLYFPLVGGSVLMAAPVAFIFGSAGGWRRVSVGFAVLALLLLLAFLSWRRIEVWQDSLSLWGDTVQKAPDSPLAVVSYGEALLAAGNRDAARACFALALSLDPRNRDALLNLAIMCLDDRDYLRARQYLDLLVRLYPRYPEGWATLGNYHFLGLDLDAARACYREALRVGSEIAGLHFNLACLEGAAGNREEALQQLETALCLGYRDWHAIGTNPNLGTLRVLPQFDALLRRFGGRP